MKVTGPYGPGPATPGRPARASGGFAVGQASATGGTAPAQSAAPASGVSDVSSLMALQGVESATERRRRAIRRGGGLLDRLEELKLALLSGETGEASLERLSRSLREERPEDADPVLTGVLEQIDLRAAVELAKAEVRRSAA
ncbi:flagellar assembly protein FliX [Brevundimonas aurifodinae]|uniref:Flagellar assembly protein FliX n=2 Tax=Brevundimonas TaxID=41275 RepID=A0ABV1NQF9_9CAUL|nr:MAG: flagellar assembly regulator FliX [Brevundimonas sp. 12-68-7]OYX33278.1 MAG: flagellar assembly regulator FliX [Brevundimonas subvibrioides]